MSLFSSGIESVPGFDQGQFIDIHTHILPGLDDGARDIQETLDIAQVYANTGVTAVVATPHYLPGTAWAPTKQQIIELIEQVQSALTECKINLKILPGMEIGFHRRMEQRISSGDLLPLGNSSHYLIEPSFYDDPKELLASLNRLLDQGVGCILAHPERIEPLLSEIDTLEQLVHEGLLIQMNAASFLGEFGKQTTTFALNLSERGCCHFIASDAHSLDKRGPLNENDWKRLRNMPETAPLLDRTTIHLNRLFVQ